MHTPRGLLRPWSSPDAYKSPALGDDESLLALEAQLDDLVAQLRAAERKNEGQNMSLGRPSAGLGRLNGGGTENAVGDAQEERVEAILARLYPVERAIMAASAHSIVGLGVKARHASYVMSQYWEEPTDKIDWEAQAIRLLIEAVCEVACTPLSLRARGR
ncbi:MULTISPECIES: hypothetical protein [unclassified Bradyrhizobium]|uniref:hypothetical protein n=1 Tax=unclassified Bradyrhizobium TaxID=2631580 RepID=UPI002916E916|nr:MULTISPECIES: hypothetical protein [unclassified Bradyrhizobium]